MEIMLNKTFEKLRTLKSFAPHCASTGGLEQRLVASGTSS